MGADPGVLIVFYRGFGWRAAAWLGGHDRAGRSTRNRLNRAGVPIVRNLLRSALDQEWGLVCGGCTPGQPGGFDGRFGLERVAFVFRRGDGQKLVRLDE